jgi:hypothetical protein
MSIPCRESCSNVELRFLRLCVTLAILLLLIHDGRIYQIVCFFVPHWLSTIRTIVMSLFQPIENTLTVIGMRAKTKNNVFVRFFEPRKQTSVSNHVAHQRAVTQHSTSQQEHQTATAHLPRSSKHIEQLVTSSVSSLNRYRFDFWSYFKLRTLGGCSGSPFSETSRILRRQHEHFFLQEYQE